MATLGLQMDEIDRFLRIHDHLETISLWPTFAEHLLWGMQSAKDKDTYGKVKKNILLGGKQRKLVDEA